MTTAVSGEGVPALVDAIETASRDGRVPEQARERAAATRFVRALADVVAHRAAASAARGSTVGTRSPGARLIRLTAADRFSTVIRGRTAVTGWYASRPMSIERIFVIGAGLMGHGIAQVSAAAGKQVTLSDRTRSSPRRAASGSRRTSSARSKRQARAGGRR